MVTNYIASLQKKYPEKTLAALDPRSRKSIETAASQGLYHAVPMAYVRKPRSRDMVELSLFDEELDMLLCVEDKTVYYMPGSAEEHSRYTTAVTMSADTGDAVGKIMEAALKLSLSEQGEMKEEEARIVWVSNDGSDALLYATIIKEKREYRFVVELGRNETTRYTTLLSLSLPYHDNQVRDSSY